MKRHTTMRAWLRLLIALLAGAPASAFAFGNWKSAISFGVASSWSGATAGYSGAVQGMYSTAGGPVWHFASGAESSMLSASPAPGTVYTQAFSTTPTFTPSNGHTQLITLTGNISAWSVVAGQPGDVLTLIFIQDGTGSRTLSGTPSNVTLAGTLTLSTGANARDSLTLRYDSISGLWQEIARGLSTGGGGGSTGNWVFSGNNSDLSAAGNQGVCNGSTATGCIVGKSNAPTTLNSTLVSLRSGTSDGSTAVAGAQDTTTTWSNLTAKLFSFRTNGSEKAFVGPYGLGITPSAATSGAPNALALTGAAHTGLTASTEVSDINLNLGRTMTWAAGAITTERVFRLQPPTLAFASASTVTNAYTMAVEGAPKAGTNATLTNTSALGIFTGADAGIGITFVPNSTTQTGALWRGVDTSGNVLSSLIVQDSGQSNSLQLTSQLNGGYNFLHVSSAANGFTLDQQLNGGIMLTAASSGDYRWYSSGFSTLYFNINSSGAVTNLTMSAHHFSGNGTSPTKAPGACLGGTQTVTLDGTATDASGLITMTSTATGTAASTCATVTFNTSYSTQPHCQIAPANQAASALSGAAQLWIDYASSSTSAFVIKSNTALVAGTYAYVYDCTQ
jgi:hypothetical protein